MRNLRTRKNANGAMFLIVTRNAKKEVALTFRRDMNTWTSPI